MADQKKAGHSGGGEQVRNRRAEGRASEAIGPEAARSTRQATTSGRQVTGRGSQAAGSEACACHSQGGRPG